MLDEHRKRVPVARRRDRTGGRPARRRERRGWSGVDHPEGLQGPGVSVILRSATPPAAIRHSARVRDHHNLQPSTPLRFHTYTKFSPEMADAVDLQSLLDKLADFLLQSGFAGGKMQNPYWDDMRRGAGPLASTRCAKRSSTR